MGTGETETWQRSETERTVFYESRWRRVRRNSQECEEKNWKDLWHQPCFAKDNRASRQWLQSHTSHPRRNSKRCTVEEWNPKNPRDKEQNCRTPKTMKITSRQLKHGTWEKSIAKNRVFWNHKESRKSALLHWWTHMESRLQKVQRESRVLGLHCKRRVWIPCSFYGTRLVFVPDDCCKNNGRHRKILTDKQLTQYLRIQAKMDDAPRLLIHSKLNVQMSGRHEWPKSFQALKIPRDLP